MQAKSDFESKFHLEKMFIQESSYLYNDSQIDNLELLFKFDEKIEYLDKKTAKVALTGKVKSEDESLQASVTVVGHFIMEFSDEITDDLKKILFERNSLSILFPYLRTQLTLISNNPGAPTIILPPININAYLDDKRK